MRYIYLSPTIVVKLSSVEAVEIDGDGMAIVYTRNGTFGSLIPFDIFVSLLNNHEEGGMSQLQQDVRQLASQNQFFGG